MQQNHRLIIAALAVTLAVISPLYAVQTTGELRKWHKVTLTFDGPETSETAEINPFLNYRLNVTFTHTETGTSYRVPGYFAADGNAADSGADAGSAWRVHFSPDQTGTWQWAASFRKGDNIAVNDDPAAGAAAGYMDGKDGSFKIKKSNKKGRDFRGKGRLDYVGGHYLQFAETKDYFLKQGTDAPENLLAYADFDGDFKTDGHKDNLVKTWQPHVKDWKKGDPTWQNGKGKGLIGAINYLASEEMNAFSFLTMNITGDDRNVFPYISYDTYDRMDVSRLDQWERVFEHADTLGMFLHFKLQETENDQLLDGGELGVQRKLYFREMIARFSHHLALNWNLGEENTNTTRQLKEFCQYFKKTDPYNHLVVLHTYPGQWDKVYGPLLGDKSELTGLSIQTNKSDFRNVHATVKKWVEQSAAAGKPWAVACDEPGDATHSLVPDKDDPAHDNARTNALWGTFMAGGWGCEWYFGYKHDHSDLTCQDWRSRDNFWDQCRYALQFFDKQDIPFWEMTNNDDLTAEKDDYCFSKEGQIYLIYQKQGAPLNLDLSDGKFEYGYFNPRTGEGTKKLLNKHRVSGPEKHTFTAPDSKDWLLVIRSTNGRIIRHAAPTEPHPQMMESLYNGQIFEEKNGLLAVEAEHFIQQDNTDQRRWYITTLENNPGIEPDGDPSHADTASGNAYIEILPDTRRTHDDKLTSGENFSNEPGKMAILTYPVKINTPGRYYVWGRAYSTGSEDNGLHVGIDQQWPATGARLQWCKGKNSWWWESKQRTAKEHCGEPYKIYLDINEPGMHFIHFSMREDGFEFDKWLMTTDKNFQRPNDAGPGQ